MPIYPVERKKPLQFYVTDQEYKIITQQADKEGLTYSEYIRLACLTDACLSGNKEAWKLTLKNASKKARGYLARKFYEATERLLDEKTKEG